jgi:uncharacterized protein YjbI with pentapeptide repeats
MNTLTQYINNLDADLSLIESKVIDTDSKHDGTYEVIENECITSRTFNDLVVSGSLFSLTTFNGVSFQSCTFFGTKIENCTFVNCTFNNCKFEFTNIEHTIFNRCEFENTLWELTPVNKSTLSFCKLDANTQYFIKEEANTLVNCQTPRALEWDEVMENTLPPLPSQDSNQEDTAVLHISKFMEALTDTVKQLKAA